MATQDQNKDMESHTDKNTDNEDSNTNINSSLSKDVTEVVTSVGSNEAIRATLATHVGQMAELSSLLVKDAVSQSASIHAATLRHAEDHHSINMRILNDGASNSNMMNQGALAIAFRGAEENTEEG
jgi:hypothetical protein